MIKTLVLDFTMIVIS